MKGVSEILWFPRKNDFQVTRPVHQAPWAPVLWADRGRKHTRLSAHATGLCFLEHVLTAKAPRTKSECFLSSVMASFRLTPHFPLKNSQCRKEQNHQAGVALEVMRLLDGKMQTAE